MKLFFTSIFILCSFSLLAQQATLKGEIYDEANNTPLDYAIVSIKKSNDEGKLLGATSDGKGAFLIENIPFGKYTITISSLGFEKKILKNFDINAPIVDMKTIKLSDNKKAIKEVTVTGEKATVVLGIDKKVFNVDKNITSAGGTAADVLRNIPSVNVDLDGNLSVRGKENVTLLVDGKPSAMFGNDAATALTSIPSSSIESIEVITNPSSKFEAQGMNGIINIIMKKDRKKGYNGMLTLGGGAPYRLNAGINLNANVKKLNLFLNANGRTSKVWEKTTNQRDNYTDDLTYYSFANNNRRPLSGFINIGAEYQFDAKNKITLSQSLFTAYMKGDSKTDIINGENYATQISRQNRANQYTGNPLNGTTNLQYKHTFKDPKEDINVELNYSKSQYLRESKFQTAVFDANDSLINQYDQSNPIRGGNSNGTIIIDYTKPLGKNSRIDIGERSYFIQFKSENQPIIQFQNEAVQAETKLKNHFLFTQQVHGVYTNFATQYKNTGVQIGLRGEYFTYQGTIYQYNASSGNSYFNLFPTFFLSQKINKQHDINFSYSRRVNRPNFYQLIPFIDVNNPQDTSTGNPNLKPEFINATELSYTYQYGKSNTFITSVYYQYTENLIQKYRRFNDNGTTFSQNRNLATGQTYGFELTNKMNITPWWDATMNINLFRNKINGSNIDPTLTRTGFGGFGKLISNTKFSKDFSGQITGNYFASTVISQGEVKPYGNIDIAIKKSFFKQLATLTFTVNDLFNTIQTNTVYNLYPYYNQSVLRKNQTRAVGLNLQIKIASKSERNNADAPKKATPKKSKSSEKEKGATNRDENLKKDEGGGGEEGGK